MSKRAVILLAMSLLTVLGTTYAQFQGRRGRFYDRDLPMPADANEKTEWAFARLRYPAHEMFSSYGRGGWGSWTTDGPKAERQFVQGVRRLTRLHTRSVETVVDLDSDEVYNWPWIYGVEVGHWQLNDAQVVKLREYLNRGGFLMVDDFHGTREWAIFIESMNKVFPGRAIVEMQNSDPIFHVIYDLDQRVQVPGISPLMRGVTYEQDGYEARWRAIYDDRGRVVVAICLNMDLGDAWEWADSPDYPEQYTSLAYRIGVNYIIYAMTH